MKRQQVKLEMVDFSNPFQLLPPTGLSAELEEAEKGGNQSDFQLKDSGIKGLDEAGSAETGKPESDDIALLEQFEERAAIIEFDGGLDRAEAERLAREQVYGVRIIQQLAELVEHVGSDGRIVLVHPDCRLELERLGLL